MSVPVKHCSSCTARQQELNRLKRHVRALEEKLALLLPTAEVANEESFLCAACGHLHAKTITRHHRVPRRIAWKIPYAARKEVLGDQPEIVNLCRKCHDFVETVSSTSKRNSPSMPCASPIKEGATVTWKQLQDEILMFERIAEQITEDIVAATRTPTDTAAAHSHFSDVLRKAVERQA